MSDLTRQSLTRIGLIVGLLSGLAGLFGAFVILPYRMDAAETAIRELHRTQAADHDLIQRTDERTARMEKTLDRLLAK